MGFTGFYWVVLRCTGFFLVLIRYEWVLPSFDTMLPGFTGFYWVLLGFTESEYVFTKLQWALPSFLMFSLGFI